MGVSADQAKRALFRLPGGPVRTPFWDPFSYRFPRRRRAAPSTHDDEGGGPEGEDGKGEDRA